MLRGLKSCRGDPKIEKEISESLHRGDPKIDKEIAESLQYIENSDSITEMKQRIDVQFSRLMTEIGTDDNRRNQEIKSFLRLAHNNQVLDILAHLKIILKTLLDKKISYLSQDTLKIISKAIDSMDFEVYKRYEQQDLAYSMNSIAFFEGKPVPALSTYSANEGLWTY